MAKQHETESKQEMDHKQSSNQRRSFIKKAAMGSAIMTTVTSRPVWAGQCSLSGNMSNNTSDHGNNAPCVIKGYSPGGWSNGRAANQNLYQFIGVNVSTPLSQLFAPSVVPNSFNQNPVARIMDILPNAGGNYSNLGLHNNQSGIWRQRTAAALNSRLWFTMLDECEQNTSCVFMGPSSPVEDGFYFPWTLSEIMSKSEGALATANNAL